MIVDIQAIKAANPLTAIIQQFTNQQVVKHKIYAPWRQEDTPSVHVYDDGSWWDYGAGVGGDVIDFVGYLFFGTAYNPDVHFTEVVDRLGALEIRSLPPQPKREAPPKPKLNISLDTIVGWHEAMPPKRREYWHSRGLTDQTINEFLLGWDGKRYTIPALYRLVPFAVKRRQSDVNDGIDAKYIQIAGGRVGIFNADILWSATKCVVSEGEIDAMLLHQLGYHAVTSTGGAGSWRCEWAKFFTHIGTVKILFDNDSAGKEGAAKVRASMRRASIVTLPEGIKDVGELWAAGYAASWLHENV